jgi:hypothetical protein
MTKVCYYPSPFGLMHPSSANSRSLDSALGAAKSAQARHPSCANNTFLPFDPIFVRHASAFAGYTVLQ